MRAVAPFHDIQMGTWGLFLLALSNAVLAADSVPEAQKVVMTDVRGPVVLGPRGNGVLLLPDGTLKRFVTEGLGGNVYRNYSEVSGDGGATWGERRFEYEGPPAFLPLLDAKGEYHVFPMVARHEGEGRTIAVDFFIDVWHVKTRDKGQAWDPPQRVFAGYVGSINSVTQLSRGRIVVPFAEWIARRPEGPPTGANEITCVYSDDGGETWSQSPSRLTAPCYTDFNGSGYGACEPVILELKDKRVYMLARTETGYLYESYSADGVHWDALKPSPFLSTDAPAGLLRLPDDRILVFWNGCEKPPRVDGAGVYGGRDILHAAISSDECKTWRGFREVYRDPTRNEAPQRTGDRGTAYPMPYMAPHGKVMVMTGQGRSGATFVFDPDWLVETKQAEDFSAGLGKWSVYKPFGPAAGWWQDRVQGPVLIDHPEKPGAKALHIRRADDKAGDGAVWNFPLGMKGSLRIHLMIRSGFGGAAISLLDRFFDPTDPAGETEAALTLLIRPDGHISLAKVLEPDAWHTLRLQWDLPNHTGVVFVDDTSTVYLKPAYRNPLGINYLRVRSIADTIDSAGLLVDSVQVEVESP
ncbi:MAG: exo-alpha-sialidase [Candidatus Hydrogenedentes bacterium]|nr:exo-alpha-sialidase [Candidatus Hydrogenedentota bacterium]